MANLLDLRSGVALHSESQPSNHLLPGTWRGSDDLDRGYGRTSSVDGSEIKVLYIGGFGRSGSTLLDRCLGQMGGFFSVGELRLVWERSFLKNQLCGCGAKFKGCDFWGAVVEEAYGGFERFNWGENVQLMRDVDRTHKIVQMVSPWKNRRFLENLERYAASVGRLYGAIREVSGARVIVDSSSLPSYAYLLDTVAAIDLYVVHLVRDSRAVAYSWQRKKVRPEIPDETVYMSRHSLGKSSGLWLLYNQLNQSLKRHSTKYLFVRYEDFISQPRETFSRIVALVNEKERELPFADGRAIHLNPNHTVSGNPMRFQQGRIELRLDDEWKTKMRSFDKGLVTALTWPLLLKYGYLQEDG